MKTVTDRVSSMPGRYKMIMPDGSSQYVTLERADEPTVPGTPLNKELFDSIQEDLTQLNSKFVELEHGSDSNGHYYKFSDGTLICTKNMNLIDVAMTTPWGAMYETGSRIDLGDWPYAFVDMNYSTTISVIAGIAAISEGIGYRTASHIGSSHFFRANPMTGNISVSIIGIGRWK